MTQSWYETTLAPDEALRLIKQEGLLEGITNYTPGMAKDAINRYFVTTQLLLMPNYELGISRRVYVTGIAQPRRAEACDPDDYPVDYHRVVDRARMVKVRPQCYAYTPAIPLARRS